MIFPNSTKNFSIEERRSMSDGGQAFPCPEDDKEYRIIGMTLCDYFAGQVLRGIHPGDYDHTDDRWAEKIADDAYTIAEAMIERRDR